MSRLSFSQVPIEVQVSAGVTPGAADYLKQKIQIAVEHCPVPVHSVRARLVRHDHESGGQVIAQATLGLTGKQLRVQHRAWSVREAADLLEARLSRRLRALDRTPRQRVRAAAPIPGQAAGQHDKDPRVVRHLTIWPAPCTAEDAVGDLDFMGHDFHLFVDKDTGQDAVVYRSGSAGYRVMWTDPGAVDPLPDELRITHSPVAAASLDVGAAIDRLVATDARFVFFVDTARDRGCLLYRRHDGTYGLIVPTDAS